MATAPTMRANALAIPFTHRDDDAREASLAGNLFQVDRQIRRAKSIPAPLLERLESTDGRKRRAALADLDLYDRLGQRVYDDGFAVVSMRQLSKERTDNPDKERTVTSRRLRRLAAEGSIEAHAWPWQLAKAAAYRLPAFVAWLRLDRRLREPRAEIAALLGSETSVDGAQQTSVDGAQQTSVDTLSVLDSVDKTQPGLRLKTADRMRTRPRSTPKTARSAAAKEFLERRTPRSRPLFRPCKHGCGEITIARDGACYTTECQRRRPTVQRIPAPTGDKMLLLGALRAAGDQLRGTTEGTPEREAAMLAFNARLVTVQALKWGTVR